MTTPSPDTRRAAIDVLAQWVVATAWDYNDGDASYARFIQGLPHDVLGAISDRADCIAARPNQLEVEAARHLLSGD